MSVATHIINNPNAKLKAMIKEMQRRKLFVQAYIKKHKTIMGLEEAIKKNSNSYNHLN